MISMILGVLPGCKDFEPFPYFPFSSCCDFLRRFNIINKQTNKHNRIAAERFLSQAALERAVDALKDGGILPRDKKVKNCYTITHRLCVCVCVCVCSCDHILVLSLFFF